MKTTLAMDKTKLITAGALAAALLAPTIALAQVGAAVNTSANVTGTGANVTVDAKVEARMTKAKAAGDKEIDRRVAALGDLYTRVTGAKRLTADAKTTITTNLKAQGDALVTLKAKIDADTDIDTLKADILTVTQSYRIFALVLPQGRIIATADGIVYVADALETVAVKLDSRIKAAQSAGADVTVMTAALADLSNKTTDAKAQSSAAITLIASLAPDQGDKTKMADNAKALNDARAKLKVSIDDLKTARADAGKIVAVLKALPAASAGASASGSATTNAQ